MARRCTCTGCATGQHGDFTQLLHAAQQDEDGAHRQQAMDVISWAMPYSHAGADAFVRPHLARLYPPESNPAAGQPSPAVEAAMQRARQMAAKIVAAASQNT